ncbi:NAD(P)-dependent oxidoreductase [Dactylosporangium vinaceum]|uniref:NAD-dependent epimerase/dehydratase family protein n=1 Tax=Dactylosporangium vinaceum TaxID=53362 RepID=A0ABV5MC71_9ACTN|nr:NAD(P)-dependent oxidoreductase [Dactylosporangium vinaceum]UAB92097.1 NAD(P)-dependent oxidoreductase [Dactylosporangium vinaceum]
MILITGGLGFIGTHTTRALLAQGADVQPASRRPTPSPLLPPGVTTATLDCTDLDSLTALGRTHTITAVIHLAAAPLGTADPLDDLQHNATAALAVLRAAATWNARVVMASTIGVYAGVGALPWREDTPLPLPSPHPIPASKKVAEILALAGGADVVVARIGAIWGPGGRPSSPFIAIPAMVRGTVQPGTVHADDGADLLYAPDCGTALALLATAPTLRHRTYNVSTGHPTTNAEVAAAIPDIPTPLVPGGSGPIPYLDTTRLREEGWQPAWPLQAAVTDYRAWLSAGHLR